jgi:hypothetical protein
VLALLAALAASGGVVACTVLAGLSDHVGPSANDGSVPDVDSGPKTFCSTHPAKFCSDFDEVDLRGALAQWTNKHETNGVFELDMLDPPSGPNALRVTASTFKDVDTLLLQKMPAFDKPPTKLRLSFELKIHDYGNTNLETSTIVASILFGDESELPFNALAMGIKTFFAPLLGAAMQPPSSVPSDAGVAALLTGNAPAVAEWSGPYTMEITYQPGEGGQRTGCMQVYTATEQRLSPCIPIPSSLSSPTQVSIAIGLYSAVLPGQPKASGKASVSFDNVTFDWE